jgi:hypothetical protein
VAVTQRSSDRYRHRPFRCCSSPDTFPGERYRRIVKRRGKLKALVAVARSILVIVWHLLSDRAARYRDLGPGYYASRIGKDRKTRSHIRPAGGARPHPHPHPSRRLTRPRRRIRLRRAPPDAAALWLRCQSIYWLATGPLGSRDHEIWGGTQRADRGA